jgi:actin-related protein 6
MPRPAKAQPVLGSPDTIFVLDNGAYSLKAGFATNVPCSDSDSLARCEIIPNCLVRTRDRKTYVAAQCSEISQWGEAVFRRPMEHGQLVNWEAQKEIWDRSFFDEKTAHKQTYIQDPGTTTLLLTETPNAMPALQKNADEIIMEEWGFGGYLRIPGGHGLVVLRLPNQGS